MDADRITLGDYIMMKRKAKELSLVDLAKRAGISHPYLSQMESGHKTNPSPKVLRQIARALEEPLTSLELLAEEQSSYQYLPPLRDRLRNTATLLEQLERIIEEYVRQHSISESSCQIASDLFDKTKQMLPELQRLNEQLVAPEIPRHVKELIDAMKGMGDQELQFMRQIVAGLKSLTDKK